jgi:5-bromo-4-chloroindolyl phosphate hydrolysis protein
MEHQSNSARGGSERPGGGAPIRPGLKGLLLFLLPLPLLLTALAGLWQGDLAAVLAAGVPAALLLGGATLARRGILNALRFAERPGVTSPPPLKATAAAVTGVGTALAAFLAAGYSLAIAALFGVGAAAGVVLTYGLDPKARRITVAADAGVGADELAAILKEAYGKLDRIDAARRQLAAPEFQQRLGAIIDGSTKVIKAIEEDPKDLRRTRKFFNVYLDGVLGVTEQYARTHARTSSPDLEQNYRQLLTDMEKVCVEQYDSLLRHDVLDLDVRIEVLSTRLKHEGVI